MAGLMSPIATTPRTMAGGVLSMRRTSCRRQARPMLTLSVSWVGAGAAVCAGPAAALAGTLAGAAAGSSLRSKFRGITSAADLLKGSGRLEVSPTRFELSFTSADLSLTSTLPVHFAAPDR